VVKEQQRFRAEHPQLYEPPPPDPQPTVVVKLSNDQEFRVRFYREQAPKHVEAFLERVRSGFYVGQAIDQVYRRGAAAAPRTSVEQMHFGLEASKSDDRSTWTDARTQPSSTVLEFEDNDLSHFPGMVAAAPEAGGKSSGERIWITASDAAAEFDGRRVIFGRVVEGMEVVEYICREASFLTEEMRNSGQGQLQLNLRIHAMEIVDDSGGPAPGGAGAAAGQPPGEGAAPSGSGQGEKR
jgi:cyclophilin family peptidyl-prolyl cis-trans isomerase